MPEKSAKPINTTMHATTMHAASEGNRVIKDDTGLSLAEWLVQDDFTLVMSSGFFGFFAHCGMLQALESASIRPAAVAGSSAGALVGGCWAAGLNGVEIGDALLRLHRSDFWDPWPGPGLLRGRKFRDMLWELLPVSCFSECRVPAAFSAFDLLSFKTAILRNGELVPAVHASCAVPLMFHPVWINGRPFMDGGIADRPGIAGVETNSRVLFHHLSSRSPWRLRPPRPPGRKNLATLTINGLPRVDPFQLHRGVEALETARRETLSALKKPLRRFCADFAT